MPSTMVRRASLCTLRQLLISLLLVTAIAGCSENVRDEGFEPEEEILVFYAVHRPRDCSADIDRLNNGSYELSADGSTITTTPRWGANGRSNYEMFNLHTLRHLQCLIAESATTHSEERLSEALDVIRNWAAANPVDEPETPWAWVEHAAAWRSVVIAYLSHVADQIGALGSSERQFLLSLAEQHAEHLLRPTIYTPHHNHGLNNALGLLALSVEFPQAQDSALWFRIASERAEQQMHENVSPDGIHLEQSGFYHYYTLRSFLEIGRVMDTLQASLSDDFAQRLDKMLGAAATMADRDGTLLGMPYSSPDAEMLNSFLPDAALPQTGQGSASFRALRAGTGALPSVSFREGGYTFFLAGDSPHMRVIFHHRILDAPHEHQDAMGLSVSVDAEPLILFPSTTSIGSGDWMGYFSGPAAHNTVQVDDLPQQPLSKRPAGFVGTLFDSYKVNGALDRIGLSDGFTDLRYDLGLGRLPLNKRSTPSGGEIISTSFGGVLEYASATHSTYAGVVHRRTVARINGDIIVVRDILNSDSSHSYTQTFHFPPDSRVDISGRSGMVATPSLQARFIQLGEAAEDLCKGRMRPDKCGWYVRDDGSVEAVPAVRYSRESLDAEFVWILALGQDRLAAELDRDASRMFITHGERSFELSWSPEPVLESWSGPQVELLKPGRRPH